MSAETLSLRDSPLCSIIMLRFQGMRLLLLSGLLLVVLAPVRAAAQDDPNDAPLGDVARNLRKKQQDSPPVIDDDNLQKVIKDEESRRARGISLTYLMDGAAKGFQVSAPDVTCSLAFTANTKALLSKTQYAQMDLPSSEAAKLQGPATIEGDALSLTLFNGTNWHVSEVDVAFTVVRKGWARDASPFGDPAGSDTSAAINPFEQVRPEKKPDVTAIYRMRAAAPPWERAVFSAPLNMDLAPGDEWHWAIVQVKGYPPDAPADVVQQTAAAAQPETTPSIQPAANPGVTPQLQPVSASSQTTQ
jgi:hypothetical protein